MIQIYNPSNYNFDVNGDMTLMPIRAQLEASLGEAWTYTLEHPIDAEGRWKTIVEGANIKAPSFNGYQLFTIKQTKKNETTIVAEAVPIGMTAKDEVFIIDKRPTNKNGQQALDILTQGTRFTGTSDITKTATAYYQYVNLIEALNGGSNAFTQRWGGELIFNNLEFVINERAGGDYGVEVRYGFNIPAKGFSEDIDTRNVVTRIYPKAYNGYTMTDNGYVDSPLVENYPTLHVATMKFENVRMAEDASETEDDVIICNNQEELDAALREQCELQYEAGIDKPIVSIKADMVMLNGIVGYEDYANLVAVGLGDTVHCKHSVLDITTDARVISLVYDSLLEKTVSVTLGDFEYNYFKKVGALMKRVENAIREDGSLVAEQVQGFIDGAFAQLRLQNTIAKKQDVRAIFFEDLDPNSPTFGALAIGTQGWQISRERTADDRDWVWTTAATSEGIIANVVVTGLLSDKLGRNYWNLDTSDFRLSGATITDADIDGYATDAELGTVDTKATNAGTAASNAQTTANTAVTNAATAQTTANNAQTAAATADGKAVAAQGTANTAITNAAAAQSTADGAVTAAGNAQTTADTAITRLNGQYGTCTTAAGTATKAVTLTNANNFELFKGATIAVKFSNTNTAASPTLKVGNTDAKPIYVKGSAISSMYYWSAGSTVTFVYNGSQWEMETDDQAMTFNHLTNGGTLQGIYMQNGELYVNASYLKSGTIEADRIAGHSIAVDKITGSITNGSWGIDFLNGTMSIGTLAVGKITGTVGDSNNYINFNNGTMNISSLNASVITAGTINAARIPNISADKITSGTLSSEGTYSESYIGGGGTYTVTDSSTITGGRVAIASEAVGIAGTIYNHIALKQGQILLSATGSKSGVYAYHNKENSYYYQSNSHTTINSEGISTYLGSYYADSGTSSLMGSALTFNSSSGKIKVAGTTVTPWAYSGERLTYSSDDGPYAGHVTTSGKQLLFFVPAKKTLTGITSVSASFPSTIEVRTTNGGYLDGSASLSTSSLTRNITLVSGGFRVSMTKSSAFSNVTNNTPVTVMLKSSMTITVS